MLWNRFWEGTIFLFVRIYNFLYFLLLFPSGAEVEGSSIDRYCDGGTLKGELPVPLESPTDLEGEIRHVWRLCKSCPARLRSNAGARTPAPPDSLAAMGARGCNPMCRRSRN